jgi:hypothetical protein
MSPYARKLLAMKMLQLIAARFAAGEPALNSEEISRQLELPMRATQRLLKLLEESSLLTRTCREDNEEPMYQPASDIGSWTVATVSDALDKGGDVPIPPAQQKRLAGFANVLEKFQKTVESSPDNVLIKDIEV